VGLPSRDLKTIFDRLEDDGKIVRRDNWIGIVNFVKHQSLNPKVRRGIEIEHEKAPGDLVERLNLPPEFFSMALDSLSHPNRNSNTNPKSLFSTESSTGFSTDPSTDLSERLRRLARRKRAR